MWKWALFNRDKKIPENFPQISHQKQNMLNFILINKLHKIAASIWHMTDIWMWPGKTLCLFSPRICFGKAYVIRRKRLRHIFSSFIFPQKIQALNVFLKYLFFFFPMLYWLFLSPSLPCNVNMWHLLELSKGTSWYILHLVPMGLCASGWIFQHSHYSASTRVCIPNSIAWFRDGLREFTHELTSTISTKNAWTAAA